jgi:mono/diheme cytochrome c family protein
MRTGIYTSIAIAIVAAGIAGCGAPSDGGSATVTFESDIHALVQDRCSKCHTENAKGELSLLTLEAALKGGESGPAVVAGDADNSLLYQLVTGQVEDKRMPPKGDPLTDAQIATVKGWIDGGAK